MDTSDTPLWQPSANLEDLRKRADLIKQIRAFFDERGLLEVETPILSRYTVTDPHLSSFKTQCHSRSAYFLQTSPEYHMKRLIAAGSGPIFQITKVFRQDESGRIHNPEFTMLEWYRPEYHYHQLMDEMDLLLQAILKVKTAERLTYQDVFLRYLNIDPHTAEISALKNCAQEQGIDFKTVNDTHDLWLDLLMSHCIEPQLGEHRPIFIYDYPASQAALAVIRSKPYPVGERFEVYYRGIELANGFHELTDANEQKQRFLINNQQRKQLNLPELPIDTLFLAALENGLPPCSGVALGLDRLLMLALQKQHLREVLSFNIERA